ncbi:MAG: YdeI/OmpD-associated family protein [Flavobacteriaceae bacterium]
MKSERFEVTLVGTHGLLVPETIAKSFLDKGHKRVKIEAHFEGKSISFHGAIQQWKGNYLVSFGKRYQKALGVFPNDYFQLQFFEDTSKYGVDMPEELEAVLHSDPEAHKIFESFTAGKKRGIIYMILAYKTSQTRIDKSLLVCANLKRGIRNNPDLIKSF